MKITLLEELAGQPYPERSFTSETVKIGRDPLECHVVFDQDDWPMVSRRHAEFRQRNGRCLLVDSGSRFGTFLEGKRVLDPCEVQVGDSVQFGPGGPLMRVIAMEESVAAKAAQASDLRHSPTVFVDPPRDSETY